MTLPANVGTTGILGIFTLGVEDSSDADLEPQGVPLVGATITFTPELDPAVLRNLTAVPPITVFPQPVHATTNDGGEVVGVKDPTKAGVRLISTTDPDLDNHEWTWRCDISHPSVPSLFFSFACEPDDPADRTTWLDLSTLIPVPPSPGSEITAWQQVVSTALAARAGAEAAAASVQRGVPGGVAGLDEDGDVIDAAGNKVAGGSGGGAPSGPAGGFLAGSYPNPGVNETALANSTPISNAKNRANHTGTQPISSVAGLQSGLDAKADLVGGLVPTSQIPALALTSTQTVASQAAMLALTGIEPGDLAVRTDGAGTFILTALPASTLANWTRLNAPSDAVSTVNGQTGTVVLGAADVGAQPAGSYATPADLTGKANTSSLALVATSGKYGDLVGKPKQRALPGLWVGAFYGLPVDVGLMDSSFTSGSTVVQQHQIALECTDLRVVLPFGFRASTSSTSSAETVAPSSFPTRMSIQIGAATYPLTFNGLRTPTCDGGGRLVSDPIGGVFPKGAQLTVRILNGQISGASYPLTLPATGPGINPAFTANRWQKNADLVDVTTAPSSTNPSDNLWGVGLLGRPLAENPISWGGIGDSIMHGTGDTNATGGALSWFTRAGNANVPVFRFARNGQWASAVATMSMYSMPMLSGSSHVAVALGTNDLLNNTRSYAQIVGDLTTIYRAVIAEGAKPVGVTVPPRSSSTDAWATAANQTVDRVPYQGGASSIRSQVNAWIRAGGGGLLSGFIELADVVETARDSGLWKAGYTTDGTHPNATAHAAIAAAVDLVALAA